MVVYTFPESSNQTYSGTKLANFLLIAAKMRGKVWREERFVFLWDSIKNSCKSGRNLQQILRKILFSDSGFAGDAAGITCET